MNKKTVFIDTGAWFAIADKIDQFHGKATEILHTLVESKIPMVTSNLIVHETVMLLSRKVSKIAAVIFWKKFMRMETLKLSRLMKKSSKKHTGYLNDIQNRISQSPTVARLL